MKTRYKALFYSLIIISVASSFIFYYITKDEKKDSEDLYENKITSNNTDKKTSNYGVSTNNPIAQKVGEKIIEDGGNSVDATMGVSYALAITEPHSSGLGGGGSMLIHDQNKQKPDYWEYKDKSSSRYIKGDQSGVPGFVQGIHDTHKKYGKMSDKKIFDYVIPLAEDGFEVNSELEMSIKKYSKGIDKSSPFFKGDGNAVKNGDIVRQPQLTKTLKGIKNNGPNYFYDKLAKHLTTELDGQIDKTDFNNYKSKQKKPSETKYLNTHVYSSSNPLGGGLMLQGLKLDEMLNNGQSDEQYLNSVLSGRDLMYSNRDIVNAKMNFSQEYLSNMYISNKYNNQNTSDSISDNSVKKTSTLHFVVVDKQGQMTSTTNTLSGYFGSGKYMDEGFYMNNSMTNFSDNKDSNNYHAKNTVPRSYISPTIIVGPDYYMGIGSPGGNKIPTILNEVIIDYLRGDESLQDSIYKPRFYNDGNTVHFEKGMNKKYLDILQNQGYNIKEEKDNPNFGSVQAGIYHIKSEKTEIANDVGTR